MKNKNLVVKFKNIFLIYTILALSFASASFAPYVLDRKINGEVSLMPDKDIHITEVKYSKSTAGASQK